jgi:hypothetical protein
MPLNFHGTGKMLTTWLLKANKQKKSICSYFVLVIHITGNYLQFCHPSRLHFHHDFQMHHPTGYRKEKNSKGIAYWKAIKSH